MTTVNLQFEYMEDIIKFYFSNSIFRARYNDDIITFKEDMYANNMEWKYNYINVCELKNYDLPNNMLCLCSLYLQCECCDIRCKLPVINAMLNLDDDVLEKYMDSIILPILNYEFICMDLYEDLFELSISYDVVVRLIETYELDLSVIIYHAFRKRLSNLVTYVLDKSCFVE